MWQQTVPAMTLLQNLRLLAYCASAPIYKLTDFLWDRLPGTTRQVVRGVQFVGPASIVEDAVSVLADFQAADPKLCAMLYQHAPVNFYYCARFERDSSYRKAFIAGNETLVWGKTGVLTHIVWTAFKLKANIHVPSVSFPDAYNGSVLQRNACLQMSDWLKEHNQPSELVESYSAASSRPAEVEIYI